MTLASRLFPFTWDRVPRIQLLMRPGCHLCNDAERALNAVLGSEKVELVDITQHRELEDLYVFRIPVVLLNDEVMEEGIIGKPEARALRKALINRTSGKLSP